MPPSLKCGHGEWQNALFGASRGCSSNDDGSRLILQCTQLTTQDKTLGRDVPAAGGDDQQTIENTQELKDNVVIMQFPQWSTRVRAAWQTPDEMIHDTQTH